MKTHLKQYPASAQDAMNYILRTNADQQLHVVVSFAGRIEEARLEKAIRLAMEAQPVLGCRFVEQPKRVFWQQRTDLDSLPLCTVVETDALDRDLLEFVTQPADPCMDPLVRASIFRTAAGDTFCLKVNHVAADGRGTKEVAYLIADRYRRLEGDPAYHPAPGKFDRRGQAGILRAVGLKNIIRYRPRQLRLPSAEFHFKYAGSEHTGRTFAMRNISPADFERLKRYAHDHSATINDLVLTALYRAMFQHAEVPQDTKLPIQVSIDLRHFLPADAQQPVCNLSGALYPAIDYRPGETFEQTLAQVTASTGCWKARQPGLTGVMLIELAMLRGYAAAKAMLGGMAAPKGDRISPLLFSNFGILDSSRLVFGSSQIRGAFVLGPVMFGNGLMLTASTYAGQMTLAMGYCQGRISEEKIEAILETVSQELLDPVSAPASATALTRERL
jgi:NRPS condensation-like uncharacterized protein